MNKAVFEKPDIPGLREQGYYCVDMHCHTRYSDGLTKIKNIYKKCRKLGIGIAITDHNEIKGAVKIAKYKDILSIPGIETTSSEGIHTLFYFYNTKELEEFHKNVIKKNRSANPFSDLKISIIDIIEKSKSYNCLISASHPFSPGNTGIYRFTKKKKYRDLLKKIDFIEAINGSNFHRLNKKAVEWGKKLKKNFTGGSDSHTLGSVGNVITAAKSEDFLDSLKKESLVVGKESTFVLLAMRTPLKFRMWGRFPRFYVKKIIREIWQMT
jgi:predicted metal-dependent phosphoesterase TrpH